MSTHHGSAAIGEEWHLSLTETETALELPFFTIEATNAVYSHERALPLVEFAAAGIDVAPRALFVSELTFSRPLPDLGVDPASSRVFGFAKRYARREFAANVREDGLTDVARVDDRPLARDVGPDGHAFRYDAAYPFDADGLLAESASGRLLLASTVWAAIWPTENSYAMGGGIYPAEALATAVERQAPGATLAVEDPLDPDPERDREDLFEVLSRVRPSSGA